MRRHLISPVRSTGLVPFLERPVWSYLTLPGSKYLAGSFLSHPHILVVAGRETTSQAPAASWSNSYQIGILVGSIIVLSLFAAWEWHSPYPIMPLSIWKAPSLLPLMLAVLMSFMSFGVSELTRPGVWLCVCVCVCVNVLIYFLWWQILLWYMVAWIQVARQWSVLGCAAAWVNIHSFPCLIFWRWPADTNLTRHLSISLASSPPGGPRG